MKYLCNVNGDHRFHKLANDLKQKYGEGDLLYRFVQSKEPWVKLIIDMRNAVDHPKPAKNDVLIVENFKLSTDDKLIEPKWGLDRDKMEVVGKSMLFTIKNILSLTEELFIYGLWKHEINLPYRLKEIPEENRNPSCPVRFKVEYLPQ